MDRPNERSLHNDPVPRTGGLGVHAGILLASPITGATLPAALWLCVGGLVVVSLIDDIRGIPVGVRLLAHVLASTAIAVLLPTVLGPIAMCLVVITLAWLINLYNFMDGADGLAGGMALFGFGFYGLAAWYADGTAFAIFNFSIASAALAFLCFNFHPARIFMGDAGSVPLGFLAGSLGLIGWLQGHWAWWFPLLVFSPFIVDATVTLARRACARERVWQAHRDHYYQRLVRMGWGHRRTALAEYALMVFCGSGALAGLYWSPGAQTMLLLGTAVVYAALIAWIGMAWRNHCTVSGHEA